MIRRRGRSDRFLPGAARLRQRARVGYGNGRGSVTEWRESVTIRARVGYGRARVGYDTGEGRS
ncbi:MAG: hypothetical protein ABSH09_24055, partial [Bryobacteraceae bacterium]